MLKLPYFPPRLVIPTSFEACLTYEQQILYMWKYIEQLEHRIAELENKQT